MTRTRWLACAAISLSVLFHVRRSMALPSQRCETIELVDDDGIGRQLGLPKLIESLKAIPLTIVPRGVPADIRVNFTFSMGEGGQIRAAMQSWAEKESVELESARIRWLDDFQARRRIIQPMEEGDAQAFRQQVLEELKKQVEARTAAVVIASEPEGLPVFTVPDDKATPLNRNRTVAVLGCLREGAELEGYVAWPDGHREQFKRLANQSPGRFVVGSRASTEPPAVPESPASTDARAVDTEPAIAREKPASSTSWYWWLGGTLVVILGLLARRRIKNG